MEYFPYGEEAAAKQLHLQWEDYSINWSPYLQKAVGTNGDISKEGVKEIFNGDIRQVTKQMLKDVLDKMYVIRANWKRKYPPTEGRERPSLGINSIQMARCPCCFDNPEQYNDHMKSIHGIKTSLKRQAPPPPSAPQASHNPGFSTDQIVPLLQAIKGSNEKWVALEQLKHKPMMTS